MLRSLSDPLTVAKFQRLCGLREIRAEENASQSVCNSEDMVNGFSNNDCMKSAKLVHRNGLASAESIEKPRLAEDRRDGRRYEYDNKIFHLLFCFGSFLGYEIFYITFFPFVFWNVDEYLARRTAIMWALIMYIGQASKDLIQWSRPRCPPVIAVEKRFEHEYGMPSTHAMVGTLIPVCLVYFTYGRYQYPLYAGVLFAVCWCVLVSTSRLYMGMHTILDVIAGVLFSALLLAILLTVLNDSTDKWMVSSPISPIVVTLIAVSMMYLYPSPAKPTSTKSDTAMIVFGTCGALVGSWARLYLQGEILDSQKDSMKIIPMLVKFVFGVAVLIPLRAMLKSLVYAIVPWLLGVSNPKKTKAVCEMPHRFFTYLMIGITAVGLVPLLFPYMEMLLEKLM